MRPLWSLWLAASACSFAPAGAVTLGARDAAMAGTEAPIAPAPDAFLDAFVAPPPPPPPDACPDADGDGICDDQDDWPCGAAPAPAASTVTMQTNENGDSGTYKTTFVLTTIDVGGMAQWVVAAPGTALTLTLHYSITDTSCMADCDDQIEVGWIPGHRTGCPFDQAVSQNTGARGDLTTTVTLPATAGAYDLRSNIGQNFSCNYMGANDWWEGPPDDSRTIARVCVH